MKGNTNAAKRRLMVVIEGGQKVIQCEREGDAEDKVRWRQMIGCGRKLKGTLIEREEGSGFKH